MLIRPTLARDNTGLLPVLQLEGRLDHFSAPLLLQTVRQTCPRTPMVLHLRGVVAVDMPGLAALREAADERPGLLVTALSPALIRALSLVGPWARELQRRTIQELVPFPMTGIS